MTGDSTFALPCGDESAGSTSVSSPFGDPGSGPASVVCAGWATQPFEGSLALNGCGKPLAQSPEPPQVSAQYTSPSQPHTSEQDASQTSGEHTCCLAGIGLHP